jgi:hypothetical protein
VKSNRRILKIDRLVVLFSPVIHSSVKEETALICPDSGDVRQPLRDQDLLMDTSGKGHSVNNLFHCVDHFFIELDRHF